MELASEQTQTQARFSSIQAAFVNHYLQLKGNSVPPFNIQFYPYCDLNHSIRVRQGKVWVRISDILVEAPLPILSALLGILLHKLFHKSIPATHLRTYRHHVNQQQVRRRVLAVRRCRGRKYLSDPAGRVFDLSWIFQQLNSRHFRGKLQARLSWSRRRNRTVLAHYDPAHQTIVVNRRLDHPSIPAWLVEYVVFHEMLHASLGGCLSNGRWLVHHSRFREAERKFPHFRRAQAFIAARLWQC